MKTNRSRILMAVLASAAFAAMGATGASAQTADVAGTWTLSVDVQGSVTTPTVTLEQDGEALTGNYSSETLGEAAVSGTVSGSDVTFSFTANVEAQGQSFPLPVTYDLTLNDEGQLVGTIDLGEAGGGSVTGTREM